MNLVKRPRYGPSCVVPGACIYPQGNLCACMLSRLNAHRSAGLSCVSCACGRLLLHFVHTARPGWRGPGQLPHQAGAAEMLLCRRVMSSILTSPARKKCLVLCRMLEVRVLLQSCIALWDHDELCKPKPLWSGVCTDRRLDAKVIGADLQVRTTAYMFVGLCM